MPIHIPLVPEVMSVSCGIRNDWPWGPLSAMGFGSILRSEGLDPWEGRFNRQ